MWHSALLFVSILLQSPMSDQQNSLFFHLLTLAQLCRLSHPHNQNSLSSAERSHWIVQLVEPVTQASTNLQAK
jgi:hypothetical protein